MRERLPPPWTVGHNDDSYWVEDATGRKFAFVYYRLNPIVGTDSGARLSPDTARRITANIAKLPELLGRQKPSG